MLGRFALFCHLLNFYSHPRHGQIKRGGWVGGGGGGGGGRGSGPLMKNITKNIRFLCNTGQDPLKITKLLNQHSMLGHHRHAREKPFKWRFASGPMMARLWWYADPISPHQLKKQQQKTTLWQNFLDPHMPEISAVIAGFIKQWQIPYRGSIVGAQWLSDRVLCVVVLEQDTFILA